MRLATGGAVRPAPQVLVQGVGPWPTLIGAAPQRSRFALDGQFGTLLGEVPGSGEGHAMALDRSALLKLLEALKAADVDDRIRTATEALQGGTGRGRCAGRCG